MFCKVACVIQKIVHKADSRYHFKETTNPKVFKFYKSQYTMSIGWIEPISPVLIALITFIIVYYTLKKTGFEGTDFVFALLSAILALILISFDNMVSFLYRITPLFALMCVVLFLCLTLLAFTLGDVKSFAKPLAITALVIVIILLIFTAVDIFPSLHHSLPGTSDSSLSSSLKEFKGFLYNRPATDDVLLVISILFVGFILIKSG